MDIEKHFLPNIKFLKCNSANISLHLKSPYSPYVRMTSAELLLVQSSKGTSHELNHTTPPPSSPKQFQVVQ